MVEVFKTNVREAGEADKVIALLLHHFPGSKINFDLQDCDKVLRVEGSGFAAADIIALVSGRGFFCRALE